jgi:hypothetical protein
MAAPFHYVFNKYILPQTKTNLLISAFYFSTRERNLISVIIARKRSPNKRVW